jgi:thioredoxin 1
MTFWKRLHARGIYIAALIFLTGILIFIGSCEKNESGEIEKTEPRKAITEIESEAHFNRIIESSNGGLLLFEFYADWCAPCKILEPTLAEIAKEYRDAVEMYKINYDTNGKLAELFKVRGLPYVGFVKNKLIVNSMLGLHPKESYVKAIESYLK